MIYIFLLVGVFFLDLALKAKIESPRSQLPKEIAGGKITLCRSHNKGMMLNFLDQKPKAAAFLSTCAGIGSLLWYLPILWKKSAGHIMEKLGGALILGGAASNISDHWRRGYVVDYLKFRFRPIRNIIFNLGDLCIFLGCLLALLGQLGKGKK
ncbi:signal peptidase II [Hominifimenecus sp. rT4P-3]|uniref:signal peptidase II n=1 Tax=Hominifimenecus sp. rT4P-3 TaxID=3242979 RepID=UPI003DA62E16